MDNYQIFSLSEYEHWPGQILFLARLDVDANTDTPAKFGIRGIPTLIIYKKGEQAAQKVGALSKAQLLDFVNANI